MEKEQWLWWCVAVIRVCWTLLPQSSYIHPDEFFQTVEVPIGDVLNVSIERTWEFQSEQPLRSVLLPKLLFQPLLILINHLSSIYGLFTLTGYHVLLSHRLVMLVLSFWVDFCVYKICGCIGVHHGRSAALLLASSYVTLTFQLHSFSNSIETILVITELFIVVVLMRGKVAYNVERDCRMVMIQDLEETLESKKARVNPVRDLHRLAYGGTQNRKNPRQKSAQEIWTEAETLKREYEIEKRLIDHVKKDTDSPESIWWGGIVSLAVVNVIGVFNRPTIVLFVIGPLLWWVIKSFDSKMVYHQWTLFILSSLFSFLSVILADSFYYSEGFSLQGVFSLISRNDFQTLFTSYLKITPVNFLLYNLNPSNLAEHGLHPRYLHLVVNMPMLFCPVYVVFLYVTFLYIFKVISNFRYNASESKNAKSKSNKSSKKMANIEGKDLKSVDLTVANKMHNSFKLLLPIFVFIPLLGLSIFPHQEARFLIPSLPLIVLSISIHFSNGFGKIFWGAFLLFNLPLCLIFGCVHQGGVVPSLLYLQNLTHGRTAEISKSSIPLEINIVYSHTYMPPLHLSLIDRSKNISVHDFKGADLNQVCNRIKQFTHRKIEPKEEESNKHATYLVLPQIFVQSFQDKCSKYVKLKTLEGFFPHLSFDDLPDFRNVSDWNSLKEALTLYLFEVHVT